MWLIIISINIFAIWGCWAREGVIHPETEFVFLLGSFSLLWGKTLGRLLYKVKSLFWFIALETKYLNIVVYLETPSPSQAPDCITSWWEYPRASFCGLSLPLLLLSLLWPDAWQQTRIYFRSWFEGRVHHGTNGIMGPAVNLVLLSTHSSFYTFHLLKALHHPRTVPEAGDQVLKHTNLWGKFASNPQHPCTHLTVRIGLQASHSALICPNPPQNTSVNMATLSKPLAYHFGV